MRSILKEEKQEGSTEKDCFTGDSGAIGNNAGNGRIPENIE